MVERCVVMLFYWLAWNRLFWDQHRVFRVFVFSCFDLMLVGSIMIGSIHSIHCPHSPRICLTADDRIPHIPHEICTHAQIQCESVSLRGGDRCTQWDARRPGANRQCRRCIAADARNLWDANERARADPNWSHPKRMSDDGAKPAGEVHARSTSFLGQRASIGRDDLTTIAPVQYSAYFSVSCVFE